MGKAAVIGLTGGIASGKSTVAALFRGLGAKIVDADLLARQVVLAGSPAATEIREQFGDEVFTADGNLDRKRLGAIVFADPRARARLNQIIHPRIAEASQQAIKAHVDDGASVVLYEAALIVENGIHHGLDGLIVVSLPEDVQLARLMSRDGISEDEARARLAAQFPLDKKVDVADHVIDNSGSRTNTERQVRDVWNSIREVRP